MSLPVFRISVFMLRRLRARLTHATALAAVTLALAAPAHASGSSMPWEEPLQQILESIEGPVAKIVAVIIIIATGLALAFAASSFFLSFFSFGGGALV